MKHTGTVQNWNYNIFKMEKKKKSNWRVRVASGVSTSRLKFPRGKLWSCVRLLIKIAKDTSQNLGLTVCWNFAHGRSPNSIL